jgi:2-polyprenyl-3-methyl-5-hydroxy-6-metoxy-1,4-benzoquinol methylase
MYHNKKSYFSSINNHNLLYKNSGNKGLLDLINDTSGEILDVGCGAGDNAQNLLLKSINNQDLKIYGITDSIAEKNICDKFLTYCWLLDLNLPLPDNLLEKSFNSIIFSHVLEHFVFPDLILEKFYGLLKKDGLIYIAVPNAVSLIPRITLFRGNFPYSDSGFFDKTHLRFFTFDTVESCLLNSITGYVVLKKCAEGRFPLPFLRKFIFPRWLCSWIDKLACKFMPNLFGSQILIVLKKI